MAKLQKKPTETLKTTPEQGGPKRLLPDGTPRQIIRSLQGIQRAEMEAENAAQGVIRQKRRRWFLRALGLTTAGMAGGLTDLIF